MKIKILLLYSSSILVFSFLVVNISFSEPLDETEFSLVQNNSEEQVDCRKIYVDQENNKVKCLVEKANTIMIYDKSDLTIYHKGVKIYPYNFKIDDIKRSVSEGNCDNIAKNLYGSFFIDNETRSYVPMGLIYEKGTCIKKDLNKAVSLYENILAVSPSNTALKEKVQNIKSDISREPSQIFKRDNSLYECSNVKVIKDNIVCSHGGSDTHISKSEISSIYYKKMKIFPYASDWEAKVKGFIEVSDCANVKENLYGPLLVDNLPSANFIMAKLFDDGICENKNKILAIKCYNDALDVDYEFVSKRIKLLTAEVEEEEKKIKEIEEKERIAMQEERRRIADAERKVQEYRISVDIKCQQDCSTNKYQYNTSCYDACWSTHGLDILDKAKL